MKNSNVIVQSTFGPIIINLNDTGIGGHVVKTGYWALEDIQLIIDMMKIQLRSREKLVFYDVGANIGTHSLAIAKTFEERVFVRSFEAQRIIFNMLCGTVAINGLLNVHCHNLAVAQVSGLEIEFDGLSYDQPNAFGSLELLSPFENGDNMKMSKLTKEKVITTTLDAFDEHVDFIKMDIEGMEDKAIKGMKNLIKRSRPICYIEIAKTDRIELLNFFLESDYVGFQKIGDILLLPSEMDIGIKGLHRVF